jgi:hypothetical protein
MKRIDAYEARDGRVFFSASDCLGHEAMLDVCDALLRDVGIPANIRDIPSGMYVRVNIDAVWAARRKIVEAKLPYRHDALDLIGKRALPVGSIVGRMLDGDGDDPYCRLWSTLDRITPDGRMWEQHYFAYNPETGRGEWDGVTVPA